jgi:hypothetical protein
MHKSSSRMGNAPARCLLTAALALLPSLALADDQALLHAANRAFPGAVWADGAAVHADIDCDGQQDVAMVGISKNEVIVAVFRGGRALRPEALTYPALRFEGSTPQLQAEPLDVSDKTFRSTLGARPDGYHRSTTCMGLRLSGGDGAAVHIFWHHHKRELAAWSQ